MEKRILLQELSELLAAREKLTKKKAETFAKAFFEIIETGLDKDKFVKIKGFGTFKMVSVSERESVNVSTGERFQISGHTKISFTPDAELRDLINKPFAHFQTVILNKGTDTADFDKIDAMQEKEEENSDDTLSLDNTENSVEDQPASITTEEEVVALPAQAIEEEAEVETKEQIATPLTTEEPEETTPTLNEPAEELVAATTEIQEETSPQEETQPEVVVKETAPEAEVSAPEETPKEQEAENDKPISTSEEATSETDTEDNNMEDANSPITSPSSETNWWKVAALTLLVALLMVISYFTGYFRVFGSCSNPYPTTETTTDTLATDSLKAVNGNSAVLVQPGDSINRPDSLPTVDRAQPTAPASPRVASPAPIVKKPVPAAATPAPTPAPAPTPIVAPTPEPETPAATETYSQVPGGKYRIVGTKRSHTLQTGETLRSLALNEYGSKGYAPYIIRHNHLKNPDRVPAGAVILLPELVLAQ